MYVLAPMYFFFQKNIMDVFCLLRTFSHFSFFPPFPLCGIYNDMQKMFIIPKCELQGFSNDSFGQLKLAISVYEISHPQILQPNIFAA